MNYALKSFSVGMNGVPDENWERTFGKREKKSTWVTCVTCDQKFGSPEELLEHRKVTHL